MKLLIFVKSLDGGSGTSALKLLNTSLYKSSEEVKIKILSLEKPSFRTLKGKKIDYLNEKNFYPTKYFLSIKNILSFIRELEWYKRQTEKFQPDIVMSIDIHPNLIACIGKLFYFKKKKLIVNTHIHLDKTLEEKASPLLHFILKKLVGFLYNRSDLHLSISKELTDCLIRDFGLHIKTRTIYHGISLPTKRSARIRNKSNTVFSAGRLVDQKDFKTLIKAFQLVWEKMPGSKLLIAGDGPLRDQLQAFASEHASYKNIHFLGWEQNILTFLKKVDLFVLTSEREGFPHVLLEAMSQSLPVISTRAPFGPSEILGHGRYGILVDVSDYKTLSSKIIKVLKNINLYRKYSLLSYKRIDFFREERMLKTYRKIFSEVLAGK